MIIPCFDLWQDDQARSRDSFNLPFFDTTQGGEDSGRGEKGKTGMGKRLDGPCQGF